MNDTVIKLDGLTKVFLTDEVETHALSGVHLEINRGDYFSIAGPSGCGKSTLLSILGLLDSPTEGSYTLNGRPVQELTHSERARVRNREIGFIFQAFNLISELTIVENVEVPLFYQGVHKQQRRDRAIRKLELVGLGDRLGHRPRELSGGQQQRTAIARSLVTDPSIIMADEPTGNLDSRTGETILQLISQLHEGGMTIIMVTHDPGPSFEDESIEDFLSCRGCWQGAGAQRV